MHEGRLHHVGFIVHSIEQSMQGFLRSLEGSWDSQIFHDPIQKVKVAFLQPGLGAGAQIELVEPASEDSPVRRFLQASNGGMHHLCYEVKDLEASLSGMRTGGARLVRPPKPAVAFANRRIAWVLTRENLLIELLEETARH
ncbi:MAG TPA: VOC family protein [Bryobacteraceae bacterium]|jgi:methylmalonyl-CoA/ethylmalonyl-CoA epimerase|nr:VOC family protein [Bryobacteraceae bacterium]